MLRHDYSLSERALGFWATLMLGILAVVSLGLRYVVDPIKCWTPAQFTHAQNDYANHMCFRKTEIPFDYPDERLPVTKENPTHHQWVPFALGVAAILCLFPHVIWRMLSGLLWLDTHSLVQALADNQRYNAAGRHVMLKDSALLIQVYSKGFTFLFYFFLLLALCCALDILTCISRLAIPGLRDVSLKRYLEFSDANSDPQMSALMQRFLDSLGLDGRLCVAATADLCGPVAATDLTHHLWMAFKTTSRPGVMTSAPLQGGGSVTLGATVPPASSGPPSAPPPGVMVPRPSADADVIPLLPVSGQGL